jgi:hypothetical protein
VRESEAVGHVVARADEVVARKAWENSVYKR